MEYFNGTIIKLLNGKITSIQSFDHSNYRLTNFNKFISNMVFNNQIKSVIFSDNNLIETVITINDDGV